MKLNLPALAQRPADDEFIRPLVEEAFRQLIALMPPNSFKSIILTGAMTRGEGSVLTRLDGSKTLLSDIDFLIITADDMWHRKMRKPLVDLSKNVNATLRAKGLASHVDYLTAMATESRGWPSMISNNEVIASGVVLAGEGPVKRWYGKNIRPDTIDPRDSLAMIHTRMMGHLLYRKPLTIHPEDITGNAEFEFALYHCAKIATDLAAIVLSLRGKFACSCAERLVRMREFMQSLEGQELERRCPDLLPLVERWTKFKRAPDLREIDVQADDPAWLQGEALRTWESVRLALRTLWRWEMREIHGVSLDATLPTTANHLASQRSFFRALRGWGKVMKHPNAFPERIAKGKMIRGLLARRDPLSLTFAAGACQLFDAEFPCSLPALEASREFAPLTPDCEDDFTHWLTRLWLLLVKGGAD